MSTTTPAKPAPPSAVRAALARDRLGTVGMLHFSLTAATPLTVIAGVVVVMLAVSGQTGIPAGYVLVAAALMIFSVGYAAMARHITNSGAFYSYVAQSLGRPAGVGAAWVAAASYCALQVGLYGLLGLTAQSLAARAGAHAPWWAWALAACALVGLLGTRAVDLNGKILAGLLIVEIAVIGLFTASNFAHAADGISLDTFAPNALNGQAAGAVLAMAVLGYVGFESPAVYAEEARDRRRTVARATRWTVAILAVIYILASWSIITAAGEGDVVDAAIADPNLMFTLAADQLGSAWALIGETLLLTSVTAAALSFHNTTARYAFALGRERVAPAWMGRTAPRSCAPAAASLTQTMIGALVILTWAALGLDPLVHLFFFMGTGGGLGLLVLLTACAIAVTVFFLRDRRDEHAFTAYIAPAAACLAMGAILWLSLAHFHTLLGLDPGHPLPRVIPLAIAALALAGTAWGLLLRWRRPQVYAGIGRGARADLARTAAQQTVGDQ